MYIHVYTCVALRRMLTSARITRVNNICVCYVAISIDISTHADFQGYHATVGGCFDQCVWLPMISCIT